MIYLQTSLRVLVVSMLSIASHAAAESCVKIDESRDALSSSERMAAVALMENGFRQVGETIVNHPCERTFLLSSARLGRTITTTVKGPNGTRTFQVQRIEDLGAAMEQMSHSLITGSILGNTSGNSIGRNNVLVQQIQPNRIENDAVLFLGVGPSYLVGTEARGVPSAIAVGMRLELDGAAIDFTGQYLSEIVDRSKKGNQGLLGTVSGVYFFDPMANRTSFVSAGFGLSVLSAHRKDIEYAGGGLHAKAAVGYEMFRASMMRFIVQAEVTLPMYYLDQEDDGMRPAGGDPIYAPVIGISVGGAFAQPQKTITVRHR
jgi:hypothetical protein